MFALDGSESRSYNSMLSCQHLRHDKNFVSPGIFNFGPRCVTAHVYISAARIKWTKHVSRLVWHCLSGWKRCGSGRLGRLRCSWFRLRRFAVRDRRIRFSRPLSSCRLGLSPWLWRRGHLRRWSGVTGLGYIGFDCIRRSDHGWFVAVALKSIMYGRSRDVIRTDCHVACHVI
jgi:hypothetical protein